MKIGLVCPYDMFTRTGGVQQLITHLHDGLTKKGHQVKIITPRPPGFKDEAPEDYIILGSTTNFNAGFGVAGNWGLPVDEKEVEEVLDREKFDVINFHEPWAPLLAWHMIKYSNSAHVGTFHANLLDRPSSATWVNIFTPYARNLGLKMHVLTAVSPAPAALLIEKANSQAEKDAVDNIIYIPNGIELNTYRPPKHRIPLNGPDTKTVLYVGRLERRKGVEWLVKAYSEVVKEFPNTYLIIAGKGPLREKLEDSVKDLGLRNVHFAGYVDDIEKRRLMGNADVVAIPSLFGESFGIVLTEAMAMGAPVIAGNNNGYIHVLKGHGRLGLIDPKSTTDFANLLSVYLYDNAINNMLRKWSLGAVKQYDYGLVINQYEKAYQEALRLRSLHGHKNKGKNGKKQRRVLDRLLLRRHPR